VDEVFHNQISFNFAKLSFLNFSINYDLSNTSPLVHLKDLGSIDYQTAWDYQTEVHQKIKECKLSAIRAKKLYIADHTILFCEHNPVYTLGKSAKIEHLLATEAELEEKGVQSFKINRGGDITYHGPGQLTVYPIFDLDFFFHDVHKYVRFLEEVVIRVLAKFDLKGERIEGYTGVWLDDEKGQRKVCAIGVHLSRWVTMHGLALNVNTELAYFNQIIPCGIQDDNKSVTSISKELNRKIDMLNVKKYVAEYFKEIFTIEYSNKKKS